jgi:hypothetical protein
MLGLQGPIGFAKIDRLDVRYLRHCTFLLLSTLLSTDATGATMSSKEEANLAGRLSECN